jgi:hypothetical protein
MARHLCGAMAWAYLLLLMIGFYVYIMTMLIPFVEFESGRTGLCGLVNDTCPIISALLTCSINYVLFILFLEHILQCILVTVMEHEVFGLLVAVLEAKLLGVSLSMRAVVVLSALFVLCRCRIPRR